MRTLRARFFVLLALALVLVLVLLLSGIGTADAVTLAAVIALQVIAGSCVWLAIRRGQCLEGQDWAMGLALGPSMIAIVGVAANLPLSPVTLSILVSMLAVSTLRLGPYRVVRDAQLERLPWSIPVAAVLALLGNFQFWRAHPLQWDGWWPYHADVVYHMGASLSVAEFGPGQQPFVSGEGPFRYHWLTNAWAGQLAMALDVPIASVITRAVFVLAAIGCSAAAWVLVRDLAQDHVAPRLSPLYLGTAAPIAGSATLLLAAYSPTHTFAMPLLLGWAVIAVRFVRSGAKRWLTLLAVVSTLLVLGRITHSAIALAFIAGAGAFAVVTRDPRTKRFVVAGAASAIPSLVTYAAAQLGGAGSGRLTIAPDYAQELGLIPWNGPLAPWLAHLSLLVACAIPWMAVIGLWTSGALRPWAAGALTAGLSGLLGVTLITNGGSEESFLWSASTLLLPLAAVGAVMLAGRSGATRGGIALLSSIGGLIGLLAAFIVRSTSSWPAFGGLARWAMPFALVAAALVIGALARRRLGAGLLGITAVALAAMSVGTYPVKVAAALPWPQAQGPASAPLAWTTQHFEAGTWVRENTPSNDVIATNRFCNTVPEPLDCPGAFPMVTALTGRQVLVESAGRGFSPADKDSQGRIPAWARERIELQASFAADPTKESAKRLWEVGVRWFWIDEAVPHASEWEPFAEIAYENDVATILRLRNPG